MFIDTDVKTTLAECHKVLAGCKSELVIKDINADLIKANIGEVSIS